MEKLEIKYHMNYTISYNDFVNYYDNGQILSVERRYKNSTNQVIVTYRNGEIYTWHSKIIDYYISQFGITVSFDGKYLFAQTYEDGLYCLNPKNGSVIWKTKSKKGVTNIFINDNSLLCQLPEKALQLLDIDTGELLLEKKPATSWDFYSLNNKYIICQVTARRWEIIEAKTLNTIKRFSHKEITNGNVDYCISSITLDINGDLVIIGFKNTSDEKTVEFNYKLPSVIF